jgi:hypothetical protein
MKPWTAAVVTLIALVCSFASAQTTYTRTQPTHIGRSTGDTLRAFDLPFGSANLNWIQARPNSSCAGQNAPFLGFVFTELNGVAAPYAAVTAYRFGRTMTQAKCSGPRAIRALFAGGSVYLTFSYYYGPYKYAGCYRIAETGTLTLD